MNSHDLRAGAATQAFDFLGKAQRFQDGGQE